jgi:hypothetical protein
MLKYLSQVWYILKGTRKYLPLLLLTFVLSSLLEALGVGVIGPFFGIASNPDYLDKIPLLEWAYIKLGLGASQFCNKYKCLETKNVS